MKIQDQVLKVYAQAQEHYETSKRDISRIQNIRPSQLPYCPINQFVNLAGQGLTQAQDFMSAFYTRVGTTVHDVLQTYMGTTDRFLSDWECRACRKWKRMTTEHTCCGRQMKYHEIEINYKGVVGHIDGIFVDDEGNYWIIDYKTSSTKGLGYKIKSPGPVYIEQITTYALFMWMQYRIRIKGVMLMFIARDDPKQAAIWKKEVTKEMLKLQRDKIGVYKTQHAEVMAVKTMRDALALARWGKCKNPNCKSCQSSEIKTMLKNAFKRGAETSRLPLSTLK